MWLLLDCCWQRFYLDVPFLSGSVRLWGHGYTMVEGETLGEVWLDFVGLFTRIVILAMAGGCNVRDICRVHGTTILTLDK